MTRFLEKSKTKDWFPMITISWKRKVRGKNVVNKKIMKVKSILNLKLHIGKRLDMSMRVSTKVTVVYFFVKFY